MRKVILYEGIYVGMVENVCVFCVLNSRKETIVAFIVTLCTIIHIQDMFYVFKYNKL